jgi:hypothetical protein
VDSARAVEGDCVEVVVKAERNTEPSEVTYELVIITMGGGVVTTGIGVEVVDDVSVEVSEGENEGVGIGVGVGVGVGGVGENGEENGVEEHEDPKRVDNTVTGTSNVNVAGTKIVVIPPEEREVRNHWEKYVLKKLSCAPGKVVK